MNYTAYTCFRRSETGQICFFSKEATTLEQFMYMVNGFYRDWGSKPAELLTWKSGDPDFDHVERDCDESIAAGRLIERIDGKYVARGAEDSELLALQTRPQHEPASCEEEPQRAPLAWNKATPFDPFKGAFKDWKFASDCAVESQPDGCFRGLRLDGCGSFRAPKVL